MTVDDRDTPNNVSADGSGSRRGWHPRPDKRTRERQVAAAVKMYGRGASIREIAAELGRSYGWTNAALHEAGVTLRPRGGSDGRKRK